MALGAGLVADCSQIDAATMFGVAGGAIGRWDLRRMMRGAVVAIEAGAVGGFSGKCAGLLEVAGGAFFFKHGMGLRQAAAGINKVVTGKSAPDDPEQ